MDIRNQDGDSVDINVLEKMEQDLANHYIEGEDVVLELGARYGSVSCTINANLNCKTNQVVVEPDDRVWAALARNKAANGCGFHIVEGFVSSKKLGLVNLDHYYGGYGATFVEAPESSIPVFTLKAIVDRYGLSFNVLVADCEGFLEVFFDENPEFYDELRLVVFEADYPDKCNYDKIRARLQEKGFIEFVGGFQNVWKR